MRVLYMALYIGLDYSLLHFLCGFVVHHTADLHEARHHVAECVVEGCEAEARRVGDLVVAQVWRSSRVRLGPSLLAYYL